MLLGVKPLAFLVRLLVFFALAYALWEPFAPVYTRLLGVLAQGAVWVTELFGTEATRAATTVVTRDNAIFFFHRRFPGFPPPGIPGDWVQANMVLLIPLMLATPAPELKARFLRLGLALGIALALQVLGVVVNIKATWAANLGAFSFQHYGWGQRKAYQFLDAFFQAFDTQLFPVAIWAGIHFRQLLSAVPGIGSRSQPPGRAGGAIREDGKKRRRG